MSEDRHSQAETLELITDEHEKAQREAENGVRQFKTAIKIIADQLLEDARTFKLTQSLILQLMRRL